MLVSLKNTEPLVGLSRVPRIWSKVLFPEPEEPTIDDNEPSFNVKLTFFKT